MKVHAPGSSAGATVTLRASVPPLRTAAPPPRTVQTKLPPGSPDHAKAGVRRSVLAPGPEMMTGGAGGRASTLKARTAASPGTLLGPACWTSKA